MTGPWGESATIWMARASATLYVWTVFLLFRKRYTSARWVMSFGLIFYLVHVWGAFEYFYHWSHTVAEIETARQTAALFRVNWSGGLYLNYLFTAAWVFHCIHWWRRADASLPPGSIAVHAFLLFMFVNATIVVWILRAIR